MALGLSAGKRVSISHNLNYTPLLTQDAGGPFLGSYGASKFAQRALTQVAACEWAQYGIRVNGYAPGATDTSMGKRDCRTFVDHTDPFIQWKKPTRRRLKSWD